MEQETQNQPQKEFDKAGYPIVRLSGGSIAYCKAEDQIILEELGTRGSIHQPWRPRAVRRIAEITGRERTIGAVGARAMLLIAKEELESDDSKTISETKAPPTEAQIQQRCIDMALRFSRGEIRVYVDGRNGHFDVLFIHRPTKKSLRVEFKKDHHAPLQGSQRTMAKVYDAIGASYTVISDPNYFALKIAAEFGVILAVPDDYFDSTITYPLCPEDWDQG